MHLTEVLLDNRVECTFLDSKEAKNVIFCRPLEESLHNVATLQTRNEEFIHNFITEPTGNYLVTDVTLSDGSTYKDVRFKLIESTDVELPCSTINLSILGSPSTFTDIVKPKVLQPTILNESSDRVEKKEVYVENKFVSTDSTKDIFEARILEQRLRNEKIRLEEERQQLVVEQTRLNADRKLQKTLEDYKSELLHEYYLIGEKQKELLSSELLDSVGSIGNTLQEQFNTQQEQASRFLNEVTTANLKELKESQNRKINEIKKELNDLLNEKVENNSFAVDKRFIERSAELETLFSEKIITELESQKKQLKNDIDGITASIDILVHDKLLDNNIAVDMRFTDRADSIQTNFTEQLNSELTSFKGVLVEAALNQSTEITNKLFSEQFESLSKTLDDHKTNLNETVKQKLNEIQKLISDFDISSCEKHDHQLDELESALSNLVNEHKSELSETVTQQIVDAKEEIGKFTDKFDNYVPVLEQRLTGIEELVSNHREQLNTLATKKIEEISNTVKVFTEDVQGKIPSLDSKIVEINNRINDLIEEKRNVQKVVDSSKQYTDSAVAKASQDAKDYARRILEMGGGGGSVAQQFANGGTMKGSLNVTNGQILSGGVDIATYFGGGGGGSQTLSFNSTTAALSISNGNTVSLSALSATSGSGSNVSGLSGNWQSTYTTVSSNSANWNTAYNTSTAYQSVSSSFATKSALSNYLPLSGGTLTGGLTGTTVKANTFYGVQGTNSTYGNPIDGYVTGFGGTYGCILLNGGNGDTYNFDVANGGSGGCIDLRGGNGFGAGPYNGGNGGCIVMVGSSFSRNGGCHPAGSINTSASSFYRGGNICTSASSNYAGGDIITACGGSIITSGDNGNAGGNIITCGCFAAGGSINTSGGNGGNGGNISTCNNGGYINTTGSAYTGGYINTSAGSDQNGGYINTSSCSNHSGGFINTSTIGNADGGYINTSSVDSCGGYINTSGSGYTSGGGFINTSSSGAYGGGYINTSANSSGNGGYINTSNTGGYINTSEEGGYIDTSGLGGYIKTHNGGNINTSDDGGSDTGGSICTNNGGGSIITKNGGGSINTTGSGYIQFGYNTQRTTLSGTATANRIILLPNKSGTIALVSDFNSLTGNWQSTYTTVSANSANWNSAYSSTTALNLSSSYWNNAYTLVQGNSASWNNALSAYTFIANGSTSIFKLSSTAPFTNAAGYIVAMNGAIQTPNTDFTITYSGNNYLNLNFTPRLGSLITVQVLGNGVVTNSSVITVSSSTYNPLYAYVNSNFSVNVPTGNYMVDTTTSGVTGLLPTTPTIGTVIGFMDPYYTWATYNFTLSAPTNIENQNQAVAMNVAGFSLKAVYVGGTYGWRLVQ